MADETKGTQQNTPPEKVASSAEAEGTTPKEGPKTYTWKEIQAILRSDWQDAPQEFRTELGRHITPLVKEKDALESRLKTLEDDTFNLRETVSEYERLKDEAELAGAEGNPDALKTIQRERKLKELAEQIKKDRADIEKQRNQIADDTKAVAEWRREKLRTEVAEKYNIAAALLDKPYLDTKEAMEDFAKAIADTKGPNGSNVDLDPGVTIGGGTEDSLKKRYPSMHK